MGKKCIAVTVLNPCGSQHSCIEESCNKRQKHGSLAYNLNSSICIDFWNALVVWELNLTAPFAGGFSSSKDVPRTRGLGPGLWQTSEHDQRPVRRPGADQLTGAEGGGAHAQPGLCGKLLFMSDVYYSETCLNWHLCHPFHCVIRRLFSFLLCVCLCFLHCVIWHPVFFFPVQVPLNMFHCTFIRLVEIFFFC